MNKEKEKNNNKYIMPKEGALGKDASSSSKTPMSIQPLGGQLPGHNADIVIQPKPFNPWMEDPVIPIDATLAMFGQRGSGKTFLTTFLLFMMRAYYPYIYVFTKTKHNWWWSQFLNPEFIINGYDPEILTNILEMQREKTAKWRNDPDPHFNPYILILWDDVIPENMANDPNFIDIFFFGRHIMVANWALMQYMKTLPVRFRGNVDGFFFLNEEQFTQINCIYEDIFGRNCSYESVLNLIDNYTRDFGFLAFFKRDRTKPLFERIYHGKAIDTVVPEELQEDEDPPIEKLNIWFAGSPEYWKDNSDHLKKIISGEIFKRAKKKFKLKMVGVDDKQVWKDNLIEMKKLGFKFM